MPSGLEMKYFVLKPKGTDKYAAASRKALRTYARFIKSDDPQLASDLEEWAKKEYLAMLSQTVEQELPSIFENPMEEDDIPF